MRSNLALLLVIPIVSAAANCQSVPDRILVRNVKSSAIEAQEGILVNNINLQVLELGLSEYGVAAHRQALIAGLRSRVKAVRSLAAAKLASDGTEDAIEELLTSLQNEADAGTRANLAFALGWLGDEHGITTLTGMCDDAALPADIRLRATQQLLDLRIDACLPAASEVLQSRSADADLHVRALLLLPRFAELGDPSSSGLWELAAPGLKDASPSVRAAAADALGSIGSAEVIPQLKVALGMEQDYAARVQMKEALRKLSSAAAR